MSTRFDHCAFGPFALRTTLRMRLVPGERVERWWVGLTRMGARVWWIELLFLPVPMVGAWARRALGATNAYVVVETDRRVLVIEGDDPGRILLEEPAHRVNLGRMGRWVTITGGKRELRLRTAETSRSRSLYTP